MRILKTSLHSVHFWKTLGYEKLGFCLSVNRGTLGLSGHSSLVCFSGFFMCKFCCIIVMFFQECSFFFFLAVGEGSFCTNYPINIQLHVWKMFIYSKFYIYDTLNITFSVFSWAISLGSYQPTNTCIVLKKCEIYMVINSERVPLWIFSLPSMQICAWLFFSRYF